MRILLTGDDGYNSIGIRLLVHFLKKDHELLIAATKDQQSGVGGHLSVNSQRSKDGSTWGEAVVDGIPALWVGGYPCDAMELCVGHFERPFDLVISGINLGANVGNSVISSGTFAAAVRALSTRLAPRAIVMSWLTPSLFWAKKHSGDENISSYIDYPGIAARAFVAEAVKQKFWSSDLLNVNFPAEKTNKVRVTKLLQNMTEYYKYPLIKDMKNHQFSYPFEASDHTNLDTQYDTGALLADLISVTPCKATFFDQAGYERMSKKQ